MDDIYKLDDEIVRTKSKNPIPNDKRWETISQHPRFINLSPEEKNRAREKYWREIIVPAIIEGDPQVSGQVLGAMKKDWDRKTLPSAMEYQKEQVKRGVGNVVNMSGVQFLTPEGKKTGDFARSLGYKGLPPPSTSDQYIGGITEFGTEALMGLPWLMQSGGLGLKANLGLESASTVLGGIGSEAGGDVSSEFGFGRAPGEFVGSLLGMGAGVGGVGGTRAVRKATGTFKDRHNIWDRMTRERLGKMVGADEQYINNLMEADTISKKLQLQEAGTGFDLAQATDSPAISSLYKVYEKSTPEKAQQAFLRREKLKETLSQKEREAFPGGEGQLGDFLHDQLEAEQVRAGLLSEKITTQDTQKIGETLREIRDNKAKMVKDSLGDKYDALYYQADRENISFDMTDVGEMVIRVFGDDANAFQRPDMPSVFFDIYTKYGKNPKFDLPRARTFGEHNRRQEELAGLLKEHRSASFQEVHSLWKRVNKDLDTYSRRGDDTTTRLLAMLKADLSKKLDDIEKSGSSIGQEFAKLNAQYRSEYADIYKRGAGGSMKKRDRFGYTTRDEDIVKTYFFNKGKGGLTALDDFKRIYGDDPDAMQMLRGGIIDIFAKTPGLIDADGFIDPKKAAKFLKDHQQILDKLPKIRDELSNTVKANAAIMERMNFYRHLESFKDARKLEDVLKNDDIPRLMSFLVTNEQAMKRLANDAVMKGAGPEFARSLAHHIANGMGGNGYEYLMGNEKLLKPIFDKVGKNHYDNLKTIVRGWAIANRGPSPIGAEAMKVEDWLKKKTGTTMDSLFAQQRAAQQKRTSWQQISATIGAKWLVKFGGDVMFEATEKALFDPDLASTLAKITELGPLSDPAQHASLVSELSRNLMTAGLRSASQLAEPSGPSEIRSKWHIMRDKDIADRQKIMEENRGLSETLGTLF